MWIVWSIARAARAEKAAREEAVAKKAGHEREAERLRFLREAAAASSDGHDDIPFDGRNYPVTDGRYNPDLYRERGGYSTYQAMERWNVDDYDTYKSNIE